MWNLLAFSLRCSRHVVAEQEDKQKNWKRLVTHSKKPVLTKMTLFTRCGVEKPTQEDKPTTWKRLLITLQETCIEKDEIVYKSASVYSPCNMFM